MDTSAVCKEKIDDSAGEEVGRFAIAIGVLSQDRVTSLKTLFASLAQSRYPLTIYFLNNNETKDLGTLVESSLGAHQTLRCFWQKKNFGMAGGRKFLIDQCVEPYILFLDDDVYIDDVDLLLDCAQSAFREGSAGLAFKVIDPKTSLPRDFEVPNDSKEFDISKEQDTHKMLGACHAVRTDLVRALGNYVDDYLVWGFEEVDMARKFINEGHRIRYLPIPVVHERSPRARNSRGTELFYNYRNAAIHAARHLRLRYLFLALFVRGAYLLRFSPRLVLTKLPLITMTCIKEYFSHRAPFSKEYYSRMKRLGGKIW